MPIQPEEERRHSLPEPEASLGRCVLRVSPQISRCPGCRRLGECPTHQPQRSLGHFSVILHSDRSSVVRPVAGRLFSARVLVRWQTAENAASPSLGCFMFHRVSDSPIPNRTLTVKPSSRLDRRGGNCQEIRSRCCIGCCDLISEPAPPEASLITPVGKIR